MPKRKPTFAQAQLQLQLYDLRREAVMRESRDAILKDFWPRNATEAVAITQPEHPLNRAYRQTATYWEMVYGMAFHGVIHTEFLLESNGEGLFLFARVEPWLAQIRAATSPRAFQKAEWIAKECELGKALMTTFRARVQKRLTGK